MSDMSEVHASTHPHGRLDDGHDLYEKLPSPGTADEKAAENPSPEAANVVLPPKLDSLS